MKKKTHGLAKRVLLIALCAALAMVLACCGFGGEDETTLPPETTLPVETTIPPTTVPPTTADPGPQELSSTEIAQLAGPATVTVHTDSGLGTGFFTDDKGTLVTCYHVIDGATELSVEMSDGGIYRVNSIIDFSELYDVAVLEVNITGNAYLNVCEGTTIQGETVYALGSSRGLDGTFSNGVISAVDRKVGAITCLQTTAATSGGNSGGPLLNVYGEVVGINAMTRTDGQNLNYAIDMSMLDKLSMDKYWDMSDFQEWYVKELKRSYLVYNYDEETFERSKIHTFQSVTGTECAISTLNWTPLKTGEDDGDLAEGYVDTCGIFGYAYDQNEMDQYTEYLKTIGFKYDDAEEYRDWYFPGTAYWYINEFTGVEVIVYVFEDESLMFIEARK